MLNIDGKPEAILQDLKTYGRLLDLAALAGEADGILQGEEDFRMDVRSPRKRL